MWPGGIPPARASGASSHRPRPFHCSSAVSAATLISRHRDMPVPAGIKQANVKQLHANDIRRGRHPKGAEARGASADSFPRPAAVPPHPTAAAKRESQSRAGATWPQHTGLLVCHLRPCAPGNAGGSCKDSGRAALRWSCGALANVSRFRLEADSPIS